MGSNSVHLLDITHRGHLPFVEFEWDQQGAIMVAGVEEVSMLVEGRRANMEAAGI